VLLVLILPCCSDPPDETLLGREAAALLARPEQDVQQVELQHVLPAFVGALRLRFAQPPGAHPGRSPTRSTLMATGPKNGVTSTL
jgi:hypothetical protein